MGKKKKVSDKLRLYFRGSITKPTRIANEDDMKIISNALQECLPQRSQCAFETIWNEERISLKFVVGLKAGLRCLKQRRTKALIYDDTAGRHLTKYLNEFANKQNIPIVQACKLIDFAPKIKLQTLLVISLIDSSIKEEIYKQGDPKPKQVDKLVISEAFNKLCTLLQDKPTLQEASGSQSRPVKALFEMPLLNLVPTSGKSKAKKEARKIEAAARPKKGTTKLSHSK